jgi:tetratricopeptide (TPR) repeat protein
MMVTAIVSIALTIQQPPAEPAPAVVAEAATAWETGTGHQAASRWTERLAARNDDRAAALGLATLARLRYDYGAAEARYRELFPSDWSRADSYAVYAALGQADALLVLGRVSDADRIFEQALTGARSLGDSLVSGETLLRLGGARVRSRGLPVGRAYFDSALAILPSSAGDPAASARCRRAHLGLLLGDTTAAEALVTTLALAEDRGYRRAQAYCLRGRQIDLLYRGERDSAMAMLRQLESLRRRARDRAGLSETLLWQADVLLHQTAYGEAREVLRRALLEAMASQAAAVRASVELDLGQVFFALNDQPTAASHLDRAIGLYASLGDRRGEMLSRSWRGSVLRAAGDWAGARAEIGNALQYYRTQGDVAYQAEQYQELADVEMGAGDFAAAARELDSLEALDRRYGGGEWSVALPYQRGRVALRRGDLETARRSLEQYLAGLDSTEHLARYEVRTYLAEVSARSDRHAEAEAELATAMAELDQWRATVDDAELRAFAFQAGAQFVNDHNVSVARVLASLVEHGRVESAFALAERRRARELGDRLAQARALVAAPGPQESGGPVEPAIPTADSVAAMLPDDSTALLQYVTGGLGAPTTVFVITRSTGSGAAVRAHVAAPADSLVSAIGRFVALLEGGGAADALARELGTMLLSPALQDMSPGIRRLIVVPDGPLHRVPLDALRLPDGRYAVERYSISVAPSARVLSALWHRPRDARRDSSASVRLLAFGDPEFDSLPRLEASAREARMVARYAAVSEVRLGKEASAEYLRRAPVAGYEVVHFATHALVDEHSVARTALALAGAKDGGWVGPGDLAALKLSADLVVLSACRSAGGVVVTGEGIQGLTAPLLAAGARSVVASQWRIGDRSTVRLVEGLYRALARGLPLGEALRAGKLDAVRRGAPASEWAAFTLVGDPMVRIPLQQPRRRWPEIAGAALVLAALVYGWQAAKRRGNRPRGSAGEAGQDGALWKSSR